ncbi:Peptidyl-prolyl isomerase cwc27 [Sparganum proliferum]
MFLRQLHWRDSRHHVIVELTHHPSQLFGTSEFLHDFPQSFAIPRVEGFCQIHEGRVEVGSHLLTLLLQSTGGEDHVRGPTMTTNAALAFWQETPFQMVVQVVGENASEDLPSDALVVVAISFPLVELNDCGVLGILRDFTLTPYLQEERSQMIHDLGVTVLVDISRDHVQSGRLPAGELIHGPGGFVKRGLEIEVGVGLHLRQTGDGDVGGGGGAVG